MEIELSSPSSKKRRANIDTKQNPKKPLAIKLIIAWIIIEVALVLYSKAAGYGGYIGVGIILLPFVLYYGLWKMRRDWMWFAVLGLGVSTIFDIFIYAIASDIERSLNLDFVLVVGLNLIAMYWLIKNRKLFADKSKEQKRREGIQTRKIVLIFAGLIAYLVAYFLIDTKGEFFVYSLIFIPVWIIVVWYLLPKFWKWLN